MTPVDEILPDETVSGLEPEAAYLANATMKLDGGVASFLIPFISVRKHQADSAFCVFFGGQDFFRQRLIVSLENDLETGVP